MKPLVDVSKWQGEMDWERAGSLISGTYIKASQNWADEQFQRNWSETKRLGIPRGAYHYLVPGSDWEKQARLFAELAQGGELPPMLDVEVTGNCNTAQMASCILKFCDLADKLLGQQVGIYTRKTFWDPFVGDTGRCFERPLWVAHYTKAADPWIPDEWAKRGKSWLFWQYSADGNMLGPIYGASGSKSIDLNRFNGTDADFAMLIGAPLVTPAPIPELTWPEAMDAWARTLGYAGPKPG